MAHGGEDLATLLARSALGDRAAFRALHDLTFRQLFGVIRRIVGDNAQAEEALQDVYVRIWQSAHAFDATRGSALAWMASVARYRAIDLVRRNAVRDAPAVEGAEGAPLAEPAEGLDLADAQALAHCLAQLPEEQRQCVLLAYSHGFSREELAARFDRPVGTIKSWLHRCLAALRACLEAQERA
jgi:RNA polymerase sigma-70 factor (ECF subfamily)